MLNATKLLFVGQVRPAIEDPAYPMITCGDKDAAFTIIAESSDDVIATLPGDQAPKQLVEFASDSIPVGSFPLRVFFFCDKFQDHEWLEESCRGEGSDMVMASLELDPDNDSGLCFIRTGEGIRAIATRPVR